MLHQNEKLLTFKSGPFFFFNGPFGTLYCVNTALEKGIVWQDSPLSLQGPMEEESVADINN